MRAAKIPFSLILLHLNEREARQARSEREAFSLMNICKCDNANKARILWHGVCVGRKF